MKLINAIFVMYFIVFWYYFSNNVSLFYKINEIMELSINVIELSIS